MKINHEPANATITIEDMLIGDIGYSDENGSYYFKTKRGCACLNDPNETPDSQALVQILKAGDTVIMEIE